MGLPVTPALCTANGERSQIGQTVATCPRSAQSSSALRHLHWHQDQAERAVMTITSASRHGSDLSRIGPPLLGNGAIGGLLGGLVVCLIGGQL